MKHLFTLLIALMLISQANAQNGFSREFKSTAPFLIYGNSKAVLMQTIDSSFMAIYNVADTASGTDLVVVKLDFTGNILWEQKIVLPINIENLQDAVQMPDSTINILCTYNVPGTNYDDETYIVNIDLNGNILNTHFVTSSGICCWDISDGRFKLDNNNNLLVTHQSFGISSYFGIVQVLGANYNYLYGGNDGTALYHATMFQDADNNYLSFGHESTVNQKRASFVKRNSIFTYQWQKFFRHGAAASAKMTIADDAIRSDNHYVLLMHFEDTNALNNLYIIKTDLNGDSIGYARYINESVPYGIYSLGSNGYMVAAYSITNGTSNYMELIHLDTAFAMVARQKYRYKNFNERVFSFKIASDSCYLLAGSSDSAFTRNIHVLKVKPDLCVDPAPSFTLNYNTGYGASQAGILIQNNSDYGVIDSANTITTINFGDGPDQAFTGDTISHVYLTQGTYLITLTITTPCGTKTFSQPVTVPCTGQPYAFTHTDNLLTIDVAYNYPSVSYLWDFGDGVTATTQTATHTYAAPGTYYVCLSTINTCGSISICDSITVNCTTPVIPLPAVMKACIGTTVTLDAGNAGSAFVWSDGQTTQQASFTTAGNYTVTVTNVCGASASAAIDIQLSAYPLVDIGADTIICINDLIQLQNYASTNPYAYQWYVDNVFQGNGSSFYFSQFNLGLYHVTLIADNNGCVDSASRDITVSPTLFCDTASYCIPVYSTGTAQGDYIKRVGIGTILNITGGTGQPSYMDYTNITTTLNAGQSVTLSLEFVEVNQMYYRIWIDYNQDGVFTSNEVLSQNAVNSGISTTFTSLSANAYGGPTRMRVRCASSTNTNIDPCASYDYGQTEDYTIIIQNGTGAPIAKFNADTTHIYINDAVNFFDLSYNNPTSWEWTFTGASTPTSNLKNPTGIIYPVAGCYPVTLKSTNANGMSIKTDTCYINVDLSLNMQQNESNEKFELLPNPFNNEFKLIYSVSENATAEIRDISGRIIYASSLLKTSNSCIINLKRFSAGLYYISIKSNQKILYNSKLVKME